MLAQHPIPNGLPAQAASAPTPPPGHPPTAEPGYLHAQEVEAGILAELKNAQYRQASRVFTWLLAIQWPAAVLLAYLINQFGVKSPSIWVVALIGGAATLFPLTLARTRPTATLTRHAVAVGQMIMSGVLIYATGGRIETHFHIFGSLAILAYYRDWRVLFTATAVTAVDHLGRGILAPETIFGFFMTGQQGALRALEHAAWVIFEDIFLIRFCLDAVAEMKHIAHQQTDLALKNEQMGRLVSDLQREKEVLTQKEQAIRQTSEQMQTQKEYLSDSVAYMLGEMEKAAQGNLQVQLFSDQKDEIGNLYRGFNQTIQIIRDALEQVADTTASVTSVAQQIWASIDHISTSAKAQVNQTDTVLDTMNRTQTGLEETMDRAGQMATIATQNRHLVESGAQIVQQTVQKTQQISQIVQESTQTVERLGSASQKIGEIAVTIEDIAGQTNLLALNAEIEAARAGVHGRGFAVVADEVRKLAERTTKATGQIGSYIQTITQEIDQAIHTMRSGSQQAEEGASRASETLSALEQIKAGVHQVGQLVQEVSNALDAQTINNRAVVNNTHAVANLSRSLDDDLAQISGAVEQMNQMTEALAHTLSYFQGGATNYNHTQGDRYGHACRANLSLLTIAGD
jgi:methyl-accepting chemotaxis protein